MEAKIISTIPPSPDTYGEWWISYLDNVIMPYFTEPLLKNPEAFKTHKAKTRAIVKRILEMKRHYDIDQPKINNVEIICSIQL